MQHNLWKTLQEAFTESSTQGDINFRSLYLATAYELNHETLSDGRNRFVSFYLTEVIPQIAPGLGKADREWGFYWIVFFPQKKKKEKSLQ